MINYYQPFLLPFLRQTPYRIPHGIRQTYFISFEDALWVLLRTKLIPKDSAVLVPDFYCMDVIDNIKKHGYTPITYPIDADFRCNPNTLANQIAKIRPGTVIIFHACGIPSLDPDKLHELVQKFPNTLFIEDAVQRLTDPEHVRISGANHVVLDSLRKVSPLPGSFLYQSDRDIEVSPDSRLLEFGYIVGSILLFWIFRVCFTAGVLVRSAPLIRFAHMNILKRHDDLIGDSIGGYRGFGIVPSVHRFMNFQKIQRIKSDQVLLYMRMLIPFLRTSQDWAVPDMSQDMYGDLHVFPLVLSGPAIGTYQEIESYLYERGIIAWFKFPDAPWSKKQMVLFLPLGFHIKPSHIRHIAHVLTSLPMRHSNTV